MTENPANLFMRLKNLLGKRCLEADVERERRIHIRVDSKDYKSSIAEIVEKLHVNHLSTITGLDTGKEIEVLAHLFGAGSQVTVKTTLSREKPEVESIIDIIPGADFYEREVHDLVGVRFKGRPKMDFFILPEDWPRGVYPLRKDFNKMKQRKLRM